MAIKKAKTDPEGKQLPVRFSGEDTQHLEEMQEHLGQDLSTIIRWAVRHFHKVAAEHNWLVSSRGELINPPREPDHSPEQNHAPPPRAKALPS